MKHRTIRDLAVIWAVAISAVALGACGADKSREDAVDTRDVDKTAPHVVAFTNKYPNVATKCASPGLRVFVTTHASSTGNNVLVVPDERCR